MKDFIHPVFLIKYTTFQKLILLPSSSGRTRPTNVKKVVILLKTLRRWMKYSTIVAGLYIMSYYCQKPLNFG